MNSARYIGRFAPSPTGPLHFGSLVCALASYLDARVNNGKWLLRIDDIDPPREIPGASDSIIKSLYMHGLVWDDEITFQSRRSKHYLKALNDLEKKQLTYRCQCNRKRLNLLLDGYDGCCRKKNLTSQTPTSIRLNIDKSLSVADQHSTIIHFQDLVQGPSNNDLNREGDFIIHRKDGLYAYQLAVVVEDIAQQVSHLVRGVDLLGTTSKHIFLTQLLRGQEMVYAHIPVLTDIHGKKLSKQNHAPAINDGSCKNNLFQALQYLKQNPPLELKSRSVENILIWGIEHWNLSSLKHCQKVTKQ